MHLAQLGAANFRLLENMSLRPHRRLNLLLGANAAGKTTLLETIYCLARGKSFRGHSPSELAGRQGRHWQLAAHLEEPGHPPRKLKLGWNGAVTDIRVDAQTTATAADLVRALPAQILEPGMHRLLQDGPSYRRSFLDWGVFHVEHAFFPTWRRFHRALRQRNQALRQAVPAAQIEVWNQELAETSEQIQQLRSAYLDALRPSLNATASRMFGEIQCSLDLHPGWNGERPYAEVLRRNLERDRRMGMTVEGPHRAELRIRLDQQSARSRISRGQQKMLIAALLIAQCEHAAGHLRRVPVLLVDDFGAELSPQFQRSLLEVLCAYPGQVFVTSFERAPPLDIPQDLAVFHVEHGRVSQC